jgi:hypothetical protein
MYRLQRIRKEALYQHLIRTALLLLAARLMICAQPACGQHSSAGGGHAGAAHVSGAGHSGGISAARSTMSTPSSGSAHAPVPGAIPRASIHSPSHVFVGSGSRPGNVASSESHFSSGNNTWVEPPGTQAREGTTFAASAMSTTGSMTRAWAGAAVDIHRPQVPIVGIFVSSAFIERKERLAEGPFLGTTTIMRPPSIHDRRHFRDFKNSLFVGGCLDGFFPGLCGSAFWLGPAWGYGANCDPSVDCDGNGYLDESTVGRYGMGVDVQSESKSAEYGPFSWDGAQGFNSEDAPPKSRVFIVIYLTDGTSYGVTDYWLTAGKFNYLTTYAGENSIPMEMLDLQKTVDENAARGMEFTLRNQRLGQEQR